MMEVSAVVAQAKQQRSDERSRSVLVPAESTNDAVGGARVFHLEHRAFARFIRPMLGLCDHAIESGALESRQPVRSLRTIARHWCHMNW